MTLNFYIDPDHFPYAYQDDLSFNNKGLLEELGSANTWLLWTLRTYLELKDRFTCLLSDTIAAKGITIFFRGSVPLAQKPNREQFWVCMVADGTWHPYSHINIFQNIEGIKKYPQSWFIRHWQQLLIKKSTSRNTTPKTIYYFGDVANLAPELRSEDWNMFIKENNFEFEIPHFSQWNDYSKIDVVLGIRSFKSGETYPNKPSSKLINAWRAGVVFIGGEDSAYAHERETTYDFIVVKSYGELKSELVRLKSSPEEFQKYRTQAVACAGRFPDSFFVDQWVNLVNDMIIPLYAVSPKMGFVRYCLFISQRFFIYRSEALTLRLKSFSH